MGFWDRFKRVPREIVVTVTKEHEARADVFYARGVTVSSSCPVALAVRDALGIKGDPSSYDLVTVSTVVITVKALLRNFTLSQKFYNTPLEARAVINWYDHKDKVTAKLYPEPEWPVTFRLTLR
jgi:hypothetical protein